MDGAAKVACGGRDGGCGEVVEDQGSRSHFSGLLDSGCEEFVQTTSLKFLPAAAWALFIAADFGVIAADWRDWGYAIRLCIFVHFVLCIFVHFWRVLYGLELRGAGRFGCGRRRSGRGLNDGEGRFEADACRCGFVFQNLTDGLEGEGRELLGLFAEG